VPAAPEHRSGAAYQSEPQFCREWAVV